MIKIPSIFTNLIDISGAMEIHHSSDIYGNIWVMDYPWYRVLRFDSFNEQSGFFLARPFALAHEYVRVMMLVLGFIEPGHVTILGLGGGSLLRTLHHHLPFCHFTAVELRTKVYEIAKRYFEVPEDKRVWIVITDAELYISVCQNASTDIIFADMYGSYLMDPIQEQQQFVLECHRALTDNGWLVINFLKLPAYSSPFFQTLLKQFRVTMVCTGNGGNHILFACKSRNIDFSLAKTRLQIMEQVLDEVFLSLFRKLKCVDG